MAVKRAVGRSVSVEGAAHGAVMKELGGAEVRSHGAAAQPGHKPAPQGTGQRSAPSVSDMIGKGVKSWTELMESLSPKVEEPLPEMTKADDDAFVDDLPLGSEGCFSPANTLSAVVSTASTTAVPPLDPRLSSLKASGHYGWASFNSEVSGQTSGSSANSLDILLSQRNVDPEQMLRSLGFGFANEQEAPMLRVPVRFMQKSHANGINIAEFLAEYPELQQVMMKKSGQFSSEYSAEMDDMIDCRVPAYFPRKHFTMLMEDPTIVGIVDLNGNEEETCMTLSRDGVTLEIEDVDFLENELKTPQNVPMSPLVKDCALDDEECFAQPRPQNLDLLEPPCKSESDSISMSSGSTSSMSQDAYNYFNVMLSPNESLV